MSTRKNRRSFSPGIESLPPLSAASSLSPMSFDDGAFHFIDYATGPLQVSNQSAVFVLPTGQIQGDGNTFAPAITADNSLLIIDGGSISGDNASDTEFSTAGIVSTNSAIFLFNGTVAGGSDVDVNGEIGANVGIQISGGSFYGFGGTVIGGSCTAFNGQPAMISRSATSFWIGGGTYEAGNTGNSAGAVTAVVLSENGTNHARIDGGTFVGGLNSIGSRGNSLAAILTDKSTLKIDGGQFVGGIALRITRLAEVDFQGTDLSYENGVISGHLRDGQAIDETILFSNMTTPPTITQTSGQIALTAGQ